VAISKQEQKRLILRIKHHNKIILCRKCDKPIDGVGMHCLCATCFAVLTRYRNIWKNGLSKFNREYHPDKCRVGAIKI
jgi:hypothetical protein